jgi:uncharacterized coiled-coil protein SlyX
MNEAANASSFWAQKSKQVKNPTAPVHVVATPPQQNGFPETKSRIVLKGKRSATASATPATNRVTGMANGASATSTPKKIDWADSDDDEDFLTRVTGTKNPRIISLENEVAEKGAKVETLDAVVSTKDAHIAKLEDVVKEKDLHIANLESEVEEKDASIEELRSGNHTQFLYVQELVGEVDEKSRRIHKLEIELDHKCAQIPELEKGVAELSDVVKIVAPLPKAAVQPELSMASTTAANQDEAVDVQSDILSNADWAAQDLVESTMPLNGDFPKKGTPGPATNDSKFPKLWSPDMPKNVAPVEKPKVLKMAIDTSKFSKKAPSVSSQKAKSSDGKGHPAPIYGQSARHRTKTSVIPKFQVDKDIRHMSHAARVLFANGPEIDVMLGTTRLITLPKYILMQCSAKAYRHFTDHPEATTITFPADSMDVEVAKAHLQWMDEMTYQGRVYSLTLNADQKLDVKNLKICQAARVLGMNNTYVGHFTKVLCDRIRSSNPSLDFMSHICELAYPANDPIFDCLANNLVNQQLSKGAGKSENFDKLCAKYPLLKEQMYKIEQRVKDSRAADKRMGVKPRDGSQHRDGRWNGVNTKKNIVG